MTYYEERENMIKKAAQDAANIPGYKVLKNPKRNYFHVITPSDRVIYVQLDEFFGMDANLEYKPSRKTDSGCRCNEEPFYNITPELMKELEEDGLKFARQLKATHYKTSDEWLERYWEKDELETV